MIIEKFTITPFQQNTRVVVCKDTGRAICIDPGEKSEEIVECINENNYEFQAITLTHGHLDHVGGTLDLHKAFPDAEIILHKKVRYEKATNPFLTGVYQIGRGRFV